MEPLSINQILSACTKIMENAQELIEEAVYCPHQVGHKFRDA